MIHSVAYNPVSSIIQPNKSAVKFGISGFGRDEDDGFGRRRQQEDSDKPTSFVKSKIGRALATVLAALAGIGAISVPVRWAALEKTVDRNNYCIATNKNTGVQDDALMPGRHWKGAFMNKWVCFNNAPTRVTEEVKAFSIENIPILIKVSTAWAPDAREGARVLKVYGTGTSGDTNQNVVDALAQIKDPENKALYENALFTEQRSMIAEIAALVPASQVNKTEFYSTIHDAMLNGYVPQEVYNKFKDFIVTPQEGQQSQIMAHVSNERRPSLQERIAERYRDVNEKGEVVDADPIILISDVDSRDNDILDAAYKDALTKLANLPIQEQANRRQVAVNQAQGEANKAEADAANTVALANANAAAERRQIEANAEAAATLTTGSAENEVKAQLAAILAQNPELARVLTAEQLAQLQGTLVQGGDASVLLAPQGQ